MIIIICKSNFGCSLPATQHHFHLHGPFTFGLVISVESSTILFNFNFNYFFFFFFFCQSQLAHSLLGNFATKKTVILTAQWSSYLLFVSGMTQLLCYSQPFSIWRFYLAYATYGSLRHKKKAGNKPIPAKSFPFSLKPISISVTRIGLRPICLQKDRLHIIVLVLLAALRVMRIARS